ncbi:GPW/gp25 family protein [Atlantibacter hermannii]|uniref:GPW/gp25 family protein n=1 Tax=Atlantibacter hermannii TaxID=565 RepID=UPI002911A2F3|nr:GPW/gp25 family protein [Atlantibacter hermannii]MDU7391136.1 GPW/gp25 family protein [Atlantibacter hermannii]
MYLGMNCDTGEAITDIEHIRQSVRDILFTPESRRMARRAYGSLRTVLIDQPQNDATELQVMAATYTALSRWEQRIRLAWWVRYVERHAFAHPAAGRWP